MKKLTFICLASLMLFAGCGDKEKIDENVIAKKSVSTQVQQPTSYDYNLVTPTNRKIKLTQSNKNIWTFGDIKDKVILLDFFGTWCPPCKAEIPHLNNIRKKYGKDFEIIGIDIGTRSGTTNTPSELLSFIEEHSIKYPVTFGGDNRKLNEAVSQLNPRYSIPFMILFDKKGNYLTHYVGMVPEEMIVSDIEKALKM